jgi:hypothetical protein
VLATAAVGAALAAPSSSFWISETSPPARPPQAIVRRAMVSVRVMVAMLVATIRRRNRPSERSIAPGPAWTMG